ncbi:hypothetical protein, partial [Sodaliphilus sp.]|uniref:hypothetical protein n=1 Tax=Sodaliphilus sp. TaxID=2815818 RepID=UPI00388E7E93
PVAIPYPPAAVQPSPVLPAAVSSCPVDCAPSWFTHYFCTKTREMKHTTSNPLPFWTRKLVQNTSKKVIKVINPIKSIITIISIKSIKTKK